MACLYSVTSYWATGTSCGCVRVVHVDLSGSLSASDVVSSQSTELFRSSELQAVPPSAVTVHQDQSLHHHHHHRHQQTARDHNTPSHVATGSGPASPGGDDVNLVQCSTPAAHGGSGGSSAAVNRHASSSVLPSFGFTQEQVSAGSDTAPPDKYDAWAC